MLLGKWPGSLQNIQLRKVRMVSKSWESNLCASVRDMQFIVVLRKCAGINKVRQADLNLQFIQHSCSQLSQKNWSHSSRQPVGFQHVLIDSSVVGSWLECGEDKHICAHVCTTYLFIDISSCCVARARLKHVILLFKPPNADTCYRV